MKSIVTSVAASCLLAALALAQPTNYKITDLGPVGPAGQPFTIKNNGLISGAAASADGPDHAVLWHNGRKIDIGTPGLGGPNSMAFGVNEIGQAVGGAQTSTVDSNGEDFCGFKALGLPSPGTTCLAFVLRHGVMTPLPTLGGNNGVANMINNRGEVAGDAETAEPDPGCPAPQVLQFKPVVWQGDRTRELPTFGGDPDGVALSINDNGQVVGASGNCAPFSPQLLIPLFPVHALLWDEDGVHDLGTLGGTGRGALGNIALNINNRGEVVGVASTPEEQSHAFLWTRETGRMQDLGTLPGDIVSSAINLNDRGEVVGVSSDANFHLRAWVLRDGVPADLNTLIQADSPLHLLLACSINSRGEIIGLAVNDAGEFHGYLASPAAVRPE